MKEKITVQQASTIQDISIAQHILLEVNQWLAYKNMTLWTNDEINITKMTEYLDSKSLYLVYYDNNAVAMFCYEKEDKIFWPDAVENNSAFIHRIAIKRKFAGLGIPDFIIQWSKGKAKTEGLKFIRLDCVSNREKLCSIYEKIGFSRVANIKVDFLDVPSARYEIELKTS